MKIMTTAIVALFACAALANEPAPAAKTKEMKAAKTAPTAAATTTATEDCTKLTGKMMEDCKAKAAATTHK
jgi:hypothetical protein